MSEYKMYVGLQLLTCAESGIEAIIVTDLHNLFPLHV